jgi:PAS domain S-box-containing protein
MQTSYMALVYNAALLLAMALVFDVMTAGLRPRLPWLYNLLLGGVLGAIGVAVMFTPWVYEPGIIFDTRSILLSIVGLFFGVVPGLVAILVTALARLAIGGAAVTGIAVIVASGGLGILWRLLRRPPLSDLGARELYFFGLVVHAVMLAIFLVGFPRDRVAEIMGIITVPVIVLYPVGTMLLGLLMVNRLRREEMDARVAAGEERLRTILDNLPIPIAIKEAPPSPGGVYLPRIFSHAARPAAVRPRSSFTYFNQQFINTFGYTLAELPTTDDWWERSFPDPDERARAQAALAAVRAAASVRGGDIRLSELRVVTADGSERLVDIHVVDLGDFDVVVFQDLTAIRRTQAQLREQAALVQAAHDAIIVRDLNHKVRFWNRRAEQLYGYSADEVVGRFSVELLYRDPAPYYAAFEQLMAHGEWHGELHQITRDGRELIVDARWTLLRDESGAPEAVLAINSDITERKKLETQYLRAQRMESIGTLAGGIAHDLNNVLAPILLAVGLLKHRGPAPEQVRLLENIEASAQRAAALVRQVLSFARGTSGPRHELQLADVVQEVIHFCRETFPRNIELVVELAPDLAPIRADATQIHQLLLNLCVNSRDAMPDGGRLTVRAVNIRLDPAQRKLQPKATDGLYVLLSVEDTGVGIPPELQERIFDPFFTTKEVGQGTGLGLTTAQAVVKSHGGFLSLYSEPGQGTVFRVYLPAATPTEERAVPASLRAAPRGHNELILVVDDEPAVCAVTQELLEGHGYRVVTASDGRAALELLAAQPEPVALVLTDMMMPVMDGKALIAALLAQYPHLPIIAASGYSGNGHNLPDTKGAARVRFIAKPYPAEELLQLMAELLRPAA